MPEAVFNAGRGLAPRKRKPTQRCLTDWEECQSSTSIFIMQHGEPLREHNIESRELPLAATAKGFQVQVEKTTTCDIRVANQSSPFFINIRNPNTNMWIRAAVDRQTVFMPIYARRPDGTRRWDIPPRIGKPCWKGKSDSLNGFVESCSRDDEGFRFTFRQFGLKEAEIQIDVQKAMEKGHFPELSTGDGEPMNAAASGTAPIDNMDMCGGIIKVELFELMQFNVYGRSQEGGFFNASRNLHEAQISTRGLAIKLGQSMEKDSANGPRTCNKKEDAGRLIWKKIFFYGPRLPSQAQLEKRRETDTPLLSKNIFDEYMEKKPLQMLSEEDRKEIEERRIERKARARERRQQKKGKMTEEVFLGSEKEEADARNFQEEALASALTSGA